MLDAAASEPPRVEVRPPGPGRRTPLQNVVAQLKFLYDPFGTVAQRFARYGDVYWVEQSTGPLFVFRHPDHIKEILVSKAADFDKQHAAFQRLSLLLGDALLTSDGERWRRQRRLVQPAFARPRLAAYSTAMVDEAARCCERLAYSGKVDLSREMNRLTLSIVTRTLFGLTLDEGGQTAHAMRELNRWFATPPLFMRFQRDAAQRFDCVVATLDALIQRLIETKHQALAQNPESDDLLSALLAARDESGERLGERELRDQLLTLYLAGHETTSHALTWTLYLLSQNHAACERLREEHARVLGGRLPTFDDVSQLAYTECVIKEALRLYPPAALIPRRASADTRVGDWQIPKGAEIVMWVYQTHRDARWFPEPDRFRPERFEPEREAERPKYAWLPFGAGQRACIGSVFAMLEAQLVLATLLPKLDFEYLRRRKPRPSRGVTLAPSGGMPMRVRRV
ncbi:MAG TPA: cytochrome P450 [Polyangiales bacterium]|nr:cytochrome P450 [Polyangiales bacterium]